jgi:hypothetical protein
LQRKNTRRGAAPRSLRAPLVDVVRGRLARPLGDAARVERGERALGRPLELWGEGLERVRGVELRELDEDDVARLLALQAEGAADEAPGRHGEELLQEGRGDPADHP